MKAEEYKKQAREWKPEAFNFRGNKDNKAFVKEIMKANGFDNEGEALDFILQSFKQSLTATSESNTVSQEAFDKLAIEAAVLKASVETKDRDIEAYKIAVGSLQTQLHEKTSILEKENNLVNHPNYLELKTKLEKTLPKIFEKNLQADGKEVPETIPVTDFEMISLITDYCQRDPSKEFPFQPIAEKIYERFTKASTDEQKQEQTNESPATTNTVAETKSTAGTDNTGDETAGGGESPKE